MEFYLQILEMFYKLGDNIYPSLVVEKFYV